MRTTILLCVVLGALSAQAQSQQQATPPPPPPPTTQQYQPQPYPQPQPYYQQPYQQPYAQPAPAPYKPLRIDDWKPGEPIPEGYHSASKPRMGLVVGGALTFGIPYLISVIGGAVAIDTGSPNFWPLFVPVVGPFIQAGYVSSATEKLLFVFDGLAQVAGAAMFIVGLVAPHTYLVRDRLASVWIAPSPVITRNGGAGVGLAGGF